MTIIRTGSWLKKRLAEKHITQKDLSKLTGVSIPAISKIIIGERRGSVGTWQKILEALDIDICESVEDEGALHYLKNLLDKGKHEDECIVFYKTAKGSIIFIDALSKEEMDVNCDKALKELESGIMSIGEAYKFFVNQNDSK